MCSGFENMYSLVQQASAEQQGIGLKLLCHVAFAPRVFYSHGSSKVQCLRAVYINDGHKFPANFTE